MNVWENLQEKKKSMCVRIIVHKITLKITIKHVNIPLSNIMLILNVNSKKTLVQCLKASKVFESNLYFFFFLYFTAQSKTENRLRKKSHSPIH